MGRWAAWLTTSQAYDVNNRQCTRVGEQGFDRGQLAAAFSPGSRDAPQVKEFTTRILSSVSEHREAVSLDSFRLLTNVADENEKNLVLVTDPSDPDKPLNDRRNQRRMRIWIGMLLANRAATSLHEDTVNDVAKVHAKDAGSDGLCMLQQSSWAVCISTVQRWSRYRMSYSQFRV